MSTALRKVIKVGADENNAENLKKVQISKGLKNSTAVEQTKRAALGELGNRATLISLKGKDVQLKENLKDYKNISLRNAKPRVDTHWKRAPVLATKKLIRTESLKSINSEGSDSAPVSTRNSVKNTAELVGSTRSATLTLKANSCAQPRIITKPVPAAKPKDDVQLKREDSNLSKKSLTKLRAALSKDTKKDVKPDKLSTQICSKTATESTSTNPILRVKIKESEIQSHSVQMLNLIENIDINDSDNLYMLPEYVNDIYSYLYHLEILFPIETDYLKKQAEVTPRMRSVLLDWINEVGHQFHLITETYHMSVGIIDRYLQAVSTTSRQQLQLVGVTAVFIASKYEELYPSDIADFVYITDHAYSKTQILAMEKKIIKALDFQLSRPIPIIFLRRYSKAAKAENEHHLCSKYILELVTIEYSMAHYRPSEIAASALYLSLQLFNKKNLPADKLWTPTLEFYSRYDIEHLNPIVKKIAKIVNGAPNAKQKAVYTKFESNKFDKISKKSELYGSVIEKIINSE